MIKLCFVDTETTGFNPKSCRLVEMAWSVVTDEGTVLIEKNSLIKPVDFLIPEEVTKIHGISTETALEKGKDLPDILNEFLSDIADVSTIIGHNIRFDIEFIRCECMRQDINIKSLETIQRFCTMFSSLHFCNIPNTRGTGKKWPKLSEAYQIFTGEELIGVHGAAVDRDACMRIFFSGIDKGLWRFTTSNPVKKVEVI